MKPKVYIIAGPNGVGKTTFARTFLPKFANCEVFTNADLIAQGLSPLAPIFYLWVASEELTLARIKERVLLGGHDVPEQAVRRRFDRSIGNFMRHYRPLADSWTIYDNTSQEPTIIAWEEDGQLHVEQEERYNGLLKGSQKT